MGNDWIPATKWTRLEGKEDADRRREAHKAKPWFTKDFLLEILHNAGEWFARYSVRRHPDARVILPDPEIIKNA